MDARERTRRIHQAISRENDPEHKGMGYVTEALQLMAVANLEDDWAELGYESWQQYCDKEFGKPTPTIPTAVASRPESAAAAMDLLEMPRWHARAACKGHGDLFFASDDETPEYAEQRVAMAREICAICPVINQCRRSARETDQGVWAGHDRNPAPSLTDWADRSVVDLSGVDPSTPEGKLRMADAYEAGMTQREIGRAVGRSQRVVGQHLAKAGVTARDVQNYRMPQEYRDRRAEAVRLYESGASVGECAEKFDLSKTSIYRAIKAAGVSRPQSFHHTEKAEVSA